MNRRSHSWTAVFTFVLITLAFTFPTSAQKTVRQRPIPIVDTVKQIRRDRIESTLTREHLVLAQTPQVFRVEILRDAFERAKKDEYYGTDESSLVERMDHPVAIIRGSERNIKITRPDDLALARFYLHEEQAAR